MSLLKTWKASFPFSAPSLTRPEDVMNNGFSLAGSSSDPATGAFNGSSPVLNAPLPSGSTVRKRVREDSPSSSPQEKVPAPLAKRRKTDVLADLLPEIVDRSDTIFHASEKTYASHLLEAVQVQNTIAVFPLHLSSAFLLGSFFSWAIEAHQHAHSTGFSGTGLVVADDEKVLKVMAHEINTAFRSLTCALYCPHGTSDNTCSVLATAGVVLVSSAQLYDALEDRAFSLDQAHSLAILNAQSLKDCHPNDEIPILQIMKHFYRKNGVHHRPRVLALVTAPAINELYLDSTLLNLEMLLDSAVLGLTPSQRVELASMSTRPTEIVLLYDPVYDRKDSELTQILHKMDPTEAVYKRWFKAARHARASVGLCAQDYVWLRLSRLLEEQSEKDEGDTGHDKFKYTERDDLEGEDQIQWDVRNVLSKYSIGLPRTDPNSALFNVTPKFLRLLQILKSCTAYGEAFRGIIFVQRRSVALSLVEILRIEGPTSFIRPDALVGSRESMRNQKDILRNFALGTCNLLVATKRAEDLDLPKATFIIRYDLFESQISQAYILSRTRGQESHVVYMIERGNDSHRRILSALTEVSPDVRQWTEAMRSQGQRTMPPPYLIETSDPYHSQSEDEEMEEESLVDPTTGGQIRRQHATTVVFRLASQRRQKGVVTDPKLPLFEFRSIMDEQDPLAVECTINLPGGSQLRFSGPPSSSAAEARRSACFALCRELAVVDGILDYSLFPQRDMEPELGMSVEAIAQSQSSQLSDQQGGTKCYPRKTPDFWNHVLAGTERVLYPLVVYFVLDTPTDGPYAPMAILTRRPLPSFSSFRLYGGVDCQVQFQQGSSIHVSEEEFLNLHKFTLRLSRGVSNRAFQVDPWNQRYLYAPLRADWTPVDELLEFPDIRDDINWHGVEQGSADQWASPLPFGLPEVVEADIEDIVIQDRSAEYTRRYTVKGVRGDLNPLSKPEDSPREAAYDNLLHYIRERRVNFEGLTDESQCLVEVESIPQVMNLLNPSRTSSTKIPAKTVPKYLIPELCFKYCISWSIFRTGNLMPSVMQRIDEFLLVKELNARFFDNSINEKLLHMAICAPSHNSDTNYERLELLGDAFLKYLSSMYVFVTSPTQSEHSMHMSRQKIISNKALLIHSSRAGLPTYIQSRPFPVKLWLPPGYIVDMEKRSSDKGSSEVDKNVEEGEIKEEDPPAAVQESQFTDIAPEGSQSTAGPPSSQATAPEETLVPQASIDSIALDDQPSFTVDSLAEFPPSQDPEDSPESQNVSASQSGAKPGTTTKKRYFNKKKKLVDEDQTKLWLGDKAVADVAEAIIGAAYITGGREAALKATKALNIPVPNVDRWSDFGRKVLAPPPNLTAKLKPGTIEAVERIVGRTYKHPHLLAQALTHASIQGYEATSYERLEFIGDAILDFLVIRYIFDREKDLDPGGLTLLKGAMVSNSALAALCVWSGLHEHLLFESIYLSSTIQEYITVIKNRQADEYAAAEREHRNPGQYWLEVEPPKALSDVVESIIGAMYLSENFSPDGAETIFDNLLKPFYEKHVTTSTLSQHPTKILFEMFQARGCQSFGSVKETDDQQGFTRCQIIVHDVILSAAEDEVPKIAGHKASSFGLDALAGDKDFLNRICNCRERLAEEKKKKRESAIASKREAELLGAEDMETGTLHKDATNTHDKTSQMDVD